MEAGEADFTAFEARLAAAWAEVKAPRHGDITEHICPECDEIANYFGGRH